VPQRETILKLIKITDDDAGMYQIGEIDGGFSDEELLEYLKSHGEYGLHQLTAKLTHIQFQIWEAWRKRNASIDDGARSGANGC